jgi:hypothetical protein
MLQIHFWADTAEYVAMACAIVAIATVIFVRLEHLRRRKTVSDALDDLLESQGATLNESVRPAAPLPAGAQRMPRGLAETSPESRLLRRGDIVGALDRVKYDLERLRFALLEQKDVRIRDEVERELKSVLMKTHPQVFAN